MEFVQMTQEFISARTRAMIEYDSEKKIVIPDIEGAIESARVKHFHWWNMLNDLKLVRDGKEPEHFTLERLEYLVFSERL
jgi:hypothetical protein